MLHHPEYRAKYAENLKRELPRIPLVGGGTGVSPVAGHGQDGCATSAFWAFGKAGKGLADLHINYESVEPYPLKYVETGEAFGVRGLAPALDSPRRASAKKAAASRRDVRVNHGLAYHDPETESQLIWRGSGRETPDRPRRTAKAVAARLAPEL